MLTNLYAKSLRVNEFIELIVPTVGAIMDDEDDYFDAVTTFTATPYDMMVQLDDAKIDFTKITSYDLFCLLFPRLQKMNTSLLFGDLDFAPFRAAINENSGEVALIDSDKGIVIDRAVHSRIGDELRKMLLLEKREKRPGNEEARRYMLERARRKQRRLKDKPRESHLESYVVALVNNDQFPYDYLTVRDISIIQFYASLNQIAHKIKFDNTMSGYYAGTIKFEDLAKSDRTWIANI